MWIESHQSLRDHPKTKRLARLLGISRVTAIGHLHCLWWWTLDYAQDGDISRFDAADIADAVEWDGNAETFYRALVQAGFIDDGDERTVHDWPEYAGRLVAKREQNAARQREWRERNKVITDTKPPVTVTSPLRSSYVEGLPNQTNQTKPNQPISPSGENIYSPEFLDFWSAYPSGHGSKPKAFAQWRKVKAEHAAIMAGLAAWQASDRWHNGYIKTCELWLRDRLWENPPPVHDPATRASPNGRPSSDDVMAEAQRIIERKRNGPELIDVSYRIGGGS